MVLECQSLRTVGVSLCMFAHTATFDMADRRLRPWVASGYRGSLCDAKQQRLVVLNS